MNEQLSWVLHRLRNMEQTEEIKQLYKDVKIRNFAAAYGTTILNYFDHIMALRKLVRDESGVASMEYKLVCRAHEAHWLKDDEGLFEFLADLLQVDIWDWLHLLNLIMGRRYSKGETATYIEAVMEITHLVSAAQSDYIQVG